MAKDKKKTNKKNNKNKNNSKKVVKEELKKQERKETIEVKKIEPKNEKVETKKEKTKRSFQLTAKEKDIVLILLVAVLLIVGLIIGAVKKENFDIELPAEITGQVGFNEITYSEYEKKIANKDVFIVVIVRDGCGYCEAYEPMVKKVAEEYNIPISYINLTNLTDKERDSLSKSNIYLKNKEWGTPTTLFMYGKKVIDSIGGYVEEDKFIEFVKKNIKVD